MAHLDKLPTYFVKGDDRRAVYFTVIASELIAEGFVEEKDENEVAVAESGARPETPVVAGKDAYTVDAPEEEFDDEIELDGVSLEEFTKAELIEYAKSLGTEVKSNLSKNDILEICINLSK